MRAHGPGGCVAIGGRRLREDIHPVAAFASRGGGVMGRSWVPPDGNGITAGLALHEGPPPVGGTVATDEAALLAMGGLPRHP